MSTPLSPPVDAVAESAQDAIVQPLASAPADDVQPVENEDYDSTFGDIESSTNSISSSIRHYRKVHGRTFHNYGETEYWGPNDEAANEFLDIGHHMYTLLLGNKLYLAPLNKNIQKVLDVGTGTGIWAIDFADEFPSAAVTGTDISPTQPSWVPANLKFEIDDAQLEWAYPADTFDYIHLRTMGGSIDNWPLLYSRAFTATKPGGWYEQMDTDIQFHTDDDTLTGKGEVILKWSKLFIGAGEKMGRSFTVIRDAKKLLEDAGFVDVVVTEYKLPVGPWMQDPKWKEIGRWGLLFMTTGLESMALYMLTSVLGWEYTEVQVLIAQMRAAIKDPKIHSYYIQTVVYGRKPE